MEIESKERRGRDRKIILDYFGENLELEHSY